jgi:hypothetical protein
MITNNKKARPQNSMLHYSKPSIIYELVRQRGKVWPSKGPVVEKRNKNTAAAAAAASATKFYAMLFQT